MGTLWTDTWFGRMLKKYRKHSEEDLYREWREEDSISRRAVILWKLLKKRLPHFESEIGKSQYYPHEVDWDEFGDEMFELLAMCEEQLSHMVTKLKKD